MKTTTAPPDTPPSLLSWAILLLLALVWGSSYILIKKGLVAFAPEQLACIRISFSTLAYFPLFLYRFRDIDWSKAKALIIVGMAGSFIPAFLFAIAQTELSSSLTGLLSSLTPLFTLLQAFIFFKMPYSWSKMVGLLLGFLGAAFLVYYGQTDSSANIWYGGLVIIACILYATSANTVKASLQDMNPFTLSAASFVLVGPPALLYLLSTDFIQVIQYHPQGWTSLGYVLILALGGTVLASLFFYWLVQLTNAVFASSVSYLVPIVALGWGILDGETVTYVHFLGIAFILCGVYIARK